MRVDSYRSVTGKLQTVLVKEGSDPRVLLPGNVIAAVGQLELFKSFDLSPDPVRGSRIGLDAENARISIERDGYYVSKAAISIAEEDGPQGASA